MSSKLSYLQKYLGKGDALPGANPDESGAKKKKKKKNKDKKEKKSSNSKFADKFK